MPGRSMLLYGLQMVVPLERIATTVPIHSCPLIVYFTRSPSMSLPREGVPVMGGKLMLGDRVKYTINGHEWIGTVVAIRSSGTTIWSPYNNMERPGIQFQLRSHD